jgi:hypothetical protein
MYVGAPGGVQDCSAARVRASAASGHQLQDGGAVLHCHRQAVQAGPQKDLPLNFSVIFRLNFIITVDEPKFYNKFPIFKFHVLKILSNLIDFIWAPFC